MFLDRLLTYQRPQFLAYYPSVCKLDKYKQVFANIQYSLLITVAMIRCLTLIIMVSTSSTTSLTIPSYTAASLVWTSPLLRLVWSSMSHLQPSHNNLLRSTLKPDHNFKIIPNLAPLGQLLIHELREYPFQTHSSCFKVQREANVKAFSLGRNVY